MDNTEFSDIELIKFCQKYEILSDFSENFITFFSLLKGAEVEELRQQKDNPKYFAAEGFHVGSLEEEQAYQAFCLLRTIERERKKASSPKGKRGKGR